MLKNPHILTLNNSFPELEHLAAGLATAGFLSRHVRPYSNKGRGWERTLSQLPFLGKVYRRTIGRRKLVGGLPRALVREHAVTLDLCMALAVRAPQKHQLFRSLNTALSNARSCAIASAGEAALSDEDAVVASWGIAEPVFQKIQKRGGLRVLNYSLAHHAFARNFLIKEAEREPAFADTLNSWDWPNWLVDRMNNEIDLADKILVGSSFVRDSFLSEGVPKEKLVILPYGVDTRLFFPSDAPFFNHNKLRVLFVGQIGQRKGISYLLRAFKRFQGPGISLTLVGRIQGDGQAFVPWQNMFRHIIHRPQIELRKFYQESDIFLFPTLLEGMPLVVLEAMASGLPVITTPNGPGGIVRDGVDGFIVPPRNVDAISDRLDQLRSDPEMRIWMGRNARRRAQSFSWEAYRRNAVSHIEGWVKKHSEHHNYEK